MLLTTQQLYAMFAMLSASALAAFLFYRLGLSTGYVTGRDTAAEHWRPLLEDKRTANTELRRLLEARIREIKTQKLNIQLEQDDHGKVERELLQRLAAAEPLTDEDQDTLLAIANELELAANTFAGLRSHDHATRARNQSARAIQMAQRLHAARANRRPHPDTALVDWLNNNATLHIDASSIALRWDSEEMTTSSDLRETLRKALGHRSRENIEAPQERAA